MGELRTMGMIDAPLSAPLALGALLSPGCALAPGASSWRLGARFGGAGLVGDPRDAARGASQVTAGFAKPRSGARITPIVNLAARHGWTLRSDGPLGAGAG